MSKSELEDFNDPGMHVTWLVSDTKAFPLNPGPTSERDRVLHFGLNYEEWLALFFDAIGVDKEGYDRFIEENPEQAQNTCVGEFDQSDPALEGFPMLSRICGILYDAVFEANEIGQLRRECLRVKSFTSNAVALNGIDKLLRICDWAGRLNLSVYLMCD